MTYNDGLERASEIAEDELRRIENTQPVNTGAAKALLEVIYQIRGAQRRHYEDGSQGGAG